MVFRGDPNSPLICPWRASEGRKQQRRRSENRPENEKTKRQGDPDGGECPKQGESALAGAAIKFHGADGGAGRENQKGRRAAVKLPTMPCPG